MYYLHLALTGQPQKENSKPHAVYWSCDVWYTGNVTELPEYWCEYEPLSVGAAMFA